MLFLLLKGNGYVCKTVTVITQCNLSYGNALEMAKLCNLQIATFATCYHARLLQTMTKLKKTVSFIFSAAQQFQFFRLKNWLSVKTKTHSLTE